MVMPRQHVVQKKGTQKCLGFFLQCCPDAYSEYVIIYKIIIFRMVIDIKIVLLPKIALRMAEAFFSLLMLFLVARRFFM